MTNRPTHGTKRNGTKQKHNTTNRVKQNKIKRREYIHKILDTGWRHGKRKKQSQRSVENEFCIFRQSTTGRAVGRLMSQQIHTQTLHCIVWAPRHVTMLSKFLGSGTSGRSERGGGAGEEKGRGNQRRFLDAVDRSKDTPAKVTMFCSDLRNAVCREDYIHTVKYRPNSALCEVNEFEVLSNDTIVQPAQDQKTPRGPFPAIDDNVWVDIDSYASASSLPPLVTFPFSSSPCFLLPLPAFDWALDSQKPDCVGQEITSHDMPDNASHDTSCLWDQPSYASEQGIKASNQHCLQDDQQQKPPLECIQQHQEQEQEQQRSEEPVLVPVTKQEGSEIANHENDRMPSPSIPLEDICRRTDEKVIEQETRPIIPFHYHDQKVFDTKHNQYNENPIVDGTGGAQYENRVPVLEAIDPNPRLTLHESMASFLSVAVQEAKSGARVKFVTRAQGTSMEATIHAECRFMHSKTLRRTMQSSLSVSMSGIYVAKDSRGQVCVAASLLLDPTHAMIVSVLLTTDTVQGFVARLGLHEEGEVTAWLLDSCYHSIASVIAFYNKHLKTEDSTRLEPVAYAMRNSVCRLGLPYLACSAAMLALMAAEYQEQVAD